MVWKPGSKHSDTSSRVIARRNDWNSICALHQGPRSRPHLEAVYMTAPRSLAEIPRKLLPRGGRPYMTRRSGIPRMSALVAENREARASAPQRLQALEGQPLGIAD